MLLRWKSALLVSSIPGLLLCACGAFGQYVYQIDNNNLGTSFNNTLINEAEDNWVGNTFTGEAAGPILHSIYYLDENGATLNVTAALYTGGPGSGMTLVAGSVNTIQVSGGGVWQTVPFASPQTVTPGETFTAALLIDDVGPSTFDFELDNSGSSTDSYYDVSSPVGSVNTYNLAAPNFPTPNGVNYPAEFEGISSTNAPQGVTLLRVDASQPASTPEPGSYALLGSLIVIAAGFLRRRPAR